MKKNEYCNVTNKQIILDLELKQRPNNTTFKLMNAYCNNQENCKYYKKQECKNFIENNLPNNIVV